MTSEKRIEKAIKLAVRYGGIDGDHHKAWVIDQMVRALAGKEYKSIVGAAKQCHCEGRDDACLDCGGTGDAYFWEVGIAP